MNSLHIEIKIGEYIISTNWGEFISKEGNLWLYGPDGDGMEFDPKDLEEVLSKFFKEKM